MILNVKNALWETLYRTVLVVNQLDAQILVL